MNVLCIYCILNTVINFIALCSYRIQRVLTMMYVRITGFLDSPSPGILNTRKLYVSETGFVPVVS
jgi:hypothetical protein